MNIQGQVCALIIISLIMFFFYANKKIGLFTEKVFSRILMGSFVCLFFDILSVILIVFDSYIPAILVTLVCKAYLIMLLWMGFSGFDYIMTDLMSEKKYHKMVRYFMGMATIESLVIGISPISWFHEGRVVYSYGLSTVFTYIFTFLFILTTVIILFVKANRLNNRRRVAIALWMSMWFVAAVIQFCFYEYLLVGFAVAMGVLIVFVMLENPESMQDRRFGCFNSHALLLFLHQVYDRGEKYAVIDFDFTEESADNEAGRYQHFNMIVDFLNKYKDVSVFKNVETEIIAFVKDAEIYKQIINNFKTEFKNYYETGILAGDSTMTESFPSLNMLTIEDCTQLKNTDDLMNLLNRMKAKLPAFKGLQIGYIDDDDIYDHYHNQEVFEEIKYALTEDRVEVFYQPIYSINEGKYVSCEALARIRKRDGSLLSPGEFIPVAEDTGLIRQLGERVFTKVCEFLKENRETECLRYVEVNLSVAQFEQNNLADKFINIMDKYGMDPSRINLEITESASIKGKTRVKEIMDKFLDKGVAFSLDDFGKGESNLMYLVEMPVSIVKLDMDMTKAYFVEPKAKYVLTATVNMAHKLGLKVVAEGVESEEELNAMKEEQIDFIQGYYFSRPVEKDKFIELIK